jgi:uncharacterized membrane protein YdbT with pleckstrin-like domain
MNDPLLRVSQWCYEGVWSGLTAWLKVPRQPPSLPATEGESIATFRPSIGYLKYIKFFFWIGLVTLDVSLSILWFVVFCLSPFIGVLITPLALAVIVLPDIVAYIAIHLRYDTTWYLISDRSLRIRRGIWKIHETTITFENIQNIRLQQGPLQRWFGFSNLIVETAGGGGHAATGGTQHIGIFEGLDNAAEIREAMLRQLRRSKTTGLNDENREPEQAAMHLNTFGSRPDVELLKKMRDLTAAIESKTTWSSTPRS